MSSHQSESPASSAYSVEWARSLKAKDLEELSRLVTPRLTKYIPHQPTIPQAAFLLLEHEEALYGGAAGGGKSDALLMAALQYVDCPGYAAILFRRTFADLNQPGALIPRSMQWLLNTDAKWNGAEHVWRFPSGAVLKFGHLDSANAELEYQGAEFQFCVARGTPVLMADGRWLAIERVAEGDEVATLIGPRRVTRTYRLGQKPLVRLDGPNGSALVSETHRMLTSGGWASPSELRPRECSECGSMLGASGPTSQGVELPVSLRRSGLPQVAQPVSPGTEGTYLQESDAWIGGVRTCCEASGDSPRGGRRPLSWSAQLALFEPVLRSGPRVGFGPTPRDAPVRVKFGRESSSSPHDCRASLDSGGGQPRSAQEAVRGCTPSPSDAGGPSRSRWPMDGPASTPGHSQMDGRTVLHPYTRVQLDCSEVALLRYVEIARAGVGEVLDLRVEEASHYVTWGGIISQNCGFDELTQFKQHQYEYLFSRLRRLAGSPIPIRMRAATNPGGPGHEWVKQRFVKYGNTRDRVFLTARLEDNPHLDRKQYERQLAKLDPVTRARLHRGDWDAKDSGGFFRREWFQLIEEEEIPRDVRWVRFWDLAATEPHEGNKDPDWTAGVLMGRKTHAGRTTFYVRDVRRFRKGPGEVEEATKTVAELDGREVEVRIEQEPGSSGKAVVGRYASDVLVGYSFFGEKSTGDKVTRAKPFSAAAFNGLVKVVSGSWNEAYFDELESFPPPGGGHDDQVDASSGSFEALTGGSDWCPQVEESDVRTREL